MTERNASVSIVGAGDFIGAAIARRFAAEGYRVHGGRRQGDKLVELTAEIEAAGGSFTGHSLDARREEEVVDFLDVAEASAPLEAVIFNVGGNVNFPILDTSERVVRKVWEMAGYAGFLTGREAARRMLVHGQGSIFFTGATASLRGGALFQNLAVPKFGLRALAQSMAREFQPQGVHVAHVIIDGQIESDRPGRRVAERGVDAVLSPDAIAETYCQLHLQAPSAWTLELDLRPYLEKF